MHNCVTSTDTMRFSFSAKKGGKRQSIFGLTYDLRYFFDDAVLYVFSPQHFGHVNSKKQPSNQQGFDCCHCQVLDQLAYAYVD